MIDAFAQLHLLRPHWLWALSALPLLVLCWRIQQRRGSAWRGNVDAHLLPHLVEPGASRHGVVGLAARLLAWTLAVLALAGPSWRQGEMPLQQDGRPLVVALDLSSAILATDLPPSRLLQARAKLATLLRERTGGDVALVAFADDAYTVMAVPNTEDGLQIVGQLQPDAVILDVMMPGIDGWELLQRLRTTHETRCIPVIICSVINDPELAFALGASQYVSKPVTRDSLRLALQQVGV